MSMIERFRELHTTGCFVMPNPWDRGSARIMERLGFAALATSSSAYARSRGKNDQELTREELVAHVADLTSFIGVPLNVDSERLYPEEPGGIQRTVELLVNAGAAGCSIEDFDPATGAIDDIDRATEAVAAAVAACSAHGLVLTGRAEGHLYGRDDLDDTILRLQRYRAAGADVVYAPGLFVPSDIARVVAEVDAPVNYLHWPDGPSVPELGKLGVRRISTGGAPQNNSYRFMQSELEGLLL